MKKSYSLNGIDARGGSPGKTYEKKHETKLGKKIEIVRKILEKRDQENAIRSLQCISKAKIRRARKSLSVTWTRGGREELDLFPAPSYPGLRCSSGEISSCI